MILQVVVVVGIGDGLAKWLTEAYGAASEEDDNRNPQYYYDNGWRFLQPLVDHLGFGVGVP